MPGTDKTLKLNGTSPIGFAEAVKAAVAEASKKMLHMDWFEVIDQRGRIADGQVREFQVTIKVGSARRGRKAMSEEEQQLVAERMRKYWQTSKRIA